MEQKYQVHKTIYLIQSSEGVQIREAKIRQMKQTRFWQNTNPKTQNSQIQTDTEDRQRENSRQAAGQV